MAGWDLSSLQPSLGSHGCTLLTLHSKMSHFPCQPQKHCRDYQKHCRAHQEHPRAHVPSEGCHEAEELQGNLNFCQIPPDRAGTATAESTHSTSSSSPVCMAQNNNMNTSNTAPTAPSKPQTPSARGIQNTHTERSLPTWFALGCFFQSSSLRRLRLFFPAVQTIQGTSNHESELSQHGVKPQSQPVKAAWLG